MNENVIFEGGCNITYNVRTDKDNEWQLQVRNSDGVVQILKLTTASTPTNIITGQGDKSVIIAFPPNSGFTDIEYSAETTITSTDCAGTTSTDIFQQYPCLFFNSVVLSNIGNGDDDVITLRSIVREEIAVGNGTSAREASSSPQLSQPNIYEMELDISLQKSSSSDDYICSVTLSGFNENYFDKFYPDETGSWDTLVSEFVEFIEPQLSQINDALNTAIKDVLGSNSNPNANFSVTGNSTSDSETIIFTLEIDIATKNALYEDGSWFSHSVDLGNINLPNGQIIRFSITSLY